MVKPDARYHSWASSVVPRKGRNESNKYDGLGCRNPEAHVYTPLDDGNIRIISLEPSLDSTSPLRFSFLNGSLVDWEDKYEAISYTWGVPSLIYPLYSNDGMTIFITENLEQALRKLRFKADKRILWADAVCINQQDNKEKSKQIPLMVDIFRGAKRVLVWLGPGGNGEENGIQALKNLSREAARVIQSVYTRSGSNSTSIMTDEGTALKHIKALFARPVSTAQIQKGYESW